MPHQLLVDNWTLQCVGSMLTSGLTGQRTDELVVRDDCSDFLYKDMSADVVNARCLFQLFNHIVFCDEVVVDGAFVGAWDRFPAMDMLSEQNFVIAKMLRETRDEWVMARDRFVQELCVCDSMRELHTQNVLHWKSTRQSKDGYFSQLIWGGAGMLARARHLHIPYASHPVRENWFAHVASIFGPAPAHRRLNEFVSNERVKIYERVDTGGYLARLNLPPVAALIVQESNDPGELLRIAFQVRAEFEPLRRWLAEFQRALDAGDTLELIEKDKLLQSVALHIKAHCSASAVGDTSLQIGLGFVKVTEKTGAPINSMQNLYGVRAAVNRLVLAPSSSSVLRKLAKLLGEENSGLGIALEADYARGLNGASAKSA